MKYLIPFLLLVATPAHAEEWPWLDLFGVDTGVPSPIPADYPYCVTVVISSEAQYLVGTSVSIFRPPFDKTDVSVMEIIRESGIGTLHNCNEAKT